MTTNEKMLLFLGACVGAIGAFATVAFIIIALRLDGVLHFDYAAGGMSERMKHELLFNVDLSMNGQCFVFVVRTDHLEPGPIGNVLADNTGHQDHPCDERP